MSEREDLIRLGMAESPVPGRETFERAVDAYRAEVLREAAAKIRAVRVTLEVKGDDVPGVLADMIDPDKGSS